MRILKNRGFTIFELVVYVSIIAVMAVGSIQAMLSITRTFSEVKSYSDIRESATSALERMIKEIRFATSIDYSGTVLGINPGRLKLNTTDEDGNTRTLEFYTLGNSLNLIDNGVDKGTITGGSTLLNNLIFRQSTTSKGMLVKIEMTLKDTRVTNSRSANFYGSAVLRGAY